MGPFCVTQPNPTHGQLWLYISVSDLLLVGRIVKASPSGVVFLHYLALAALNVVAHYRRGTALRAMTLSTAAKR